MSFVLARKLAKEARDLELEAGDLDQRLQRCRERLHTIYTKSLPDAMDQAGVDHLGLPAEGNAPACDVRVSTHIKASIPADWDDERRSAAFKALEGSGHGDLIKTEVSVAFPREKREDALSFLESAKKSGGKPTVKESVHHATLTAWLKAQVISDNPLPPLETIGGSVMRVARLEERN
jgi:hypothetical protein